MADQPVKTSPQVYARIGGVLYLIIIVAGIFGEMFVRSKLIVSGDAAATANHIMASQSLWRIGIAGDLIMHICDVPFTSSHIPFDQVTWIWLWRWSHIFRR